ncbi:MAG: dTDP-4-dehydrorhamnose 3,5-epimerase family protein, partial [Bacteroidota bacterium]
TEYFTPEADAGLNYNDPLLKINWPLPVSVISEKDKTNKYIDPTFKGI